jgi:hypothetical protein
MAKKYRNFIYSGIFLLSFLCVGFFCLSVSKSFADGINVEPPAAIAQNTETGAAAGKDLPGYMLYLFNIGMGLGVASVLISLVIAGIMYFLSPANAWARAGAKDRVSGAISGLLIILSTYLIITTINPQLSIFKFGSLPEVNIPAPKVVRAAGVYFYKSGCPDAAVQSNVSSVSDLGPLKNSVTSVEIAPDTENQTSYISILYENPSYWGKCQYINPNNQGCQSVTPFASSASIYRYDNSPNGDGVYFFRKSCYNDQAYSTTASIIDHCKTDSGGYYEVQNSDINGIYTQKLDGLTFEGVPKEEQDCTKYDDTGKCTERNPPSLDGDNISSVIISGNYLVLFIYVDSAGDWAYCQEFPTATDINKLGPRQIKWQNIRNSSSGVIPNYVVIIPVEK